MREKVLAVSLEDREIRANQPVEAVQFSDHRRREAWRAIGIEMAPERPNLGVEPQVKLPERGFPQAEVERGTCGQRIPRQAFDKFRSTRIDCFPCREGRFYVGLHLAARVDFVSEDDVCQKLRIDFVK